MNITTNIIKIARKILVSESQSDYKKFLRQKLQRENPQLEQLQLSTKIGQLNKKVKNKLKPINQKYYQYIYKWLIQGQLPQDIDSKFIPYLQQYQYLINNNQQHIQIPRNVLDSFQNLYTFIENYNKEKQPLNISVEKQKIRQQPLPFKHIASKGSYNMYEIQEDQFEDFNRLYGNNNGSEYGGLIATTSWCVALNEQYFDCEDHSPPYYLITNGRTSPEALVNIYSGQFKDIKDYPYNKDHKEVYQLVYDLADSQVALEDLYDDLQDLYSHLYTDENEITQHLDDLINNKQNHGLYRLVMDNQIKDKNQINKITKALIDNNCPAYVLSIMQKKRNLIDKNIIDEFVTSLMKRSYSQHFLYSLIKENIVTDKNKIDKIIQTLMDNQQLNFLNYLLDNITDIDQKKKIVKFLKNKSHFTT